MMTDPPRDSFREAALVVASIGAMIIAGVALTISIATGHPFEAAFSGAFATFTMVGFLILRRRPGNSIGRVFWTLGLLAPLSASAGAYAELGGPAADWVAWAGSLLTPIVFGLLLTFLPLLFPTGTLLSRRWRPVAWLAGTATGAAVVAFAFTPGALECCENVDNPAGLAVLAPYTEPVLGSGFAVLAFTAVLSAASVVVRFRRSRGDERQQLKWFTYGIALLAAMSVVAAFAPDSGDLAPTIAFPTAITVVALSTGIAILRYRLYDIDIVISRTLVFAGLATFITAIYVSIVVGIGTLLGSGDEPNLALSIIATAVVAVAFQPVRERLTRVANRLVFGKRATPYEVLSRFSEHLGEVDTPEDTLEKMARLLVEGTGAARAQVWLRVSDELRPAATWPAHMTDDADPGHRIEVTHEGEVLGALSLDKQRGETLTPADQELVEDLASQAGLVLRNLRLTAQLKAKIVELQASRQRLVAAQDEERRRLERDLHDGAQRQLLALKARLDAARATAEREQAVKAGQVLQQIASDAGDADVTLRELAHGIYPPLLAAEGLVGALTVHVSKAAVPVVVAGGIGRYSQEVEAAVYFCVLEAVQNAAKYAGPAQVTIRFSDTDGHLTFEVSDDGAGFDPATTAKGQGTTNMTDRLDALGGQLDITSSPGLGTTIEGSLPIVRRTRMVTS